MGQNIKDLLLWAKTELKHANIPDYRDAEFIIEYIIGEKLVTLQNQVLDNDKADLFKSMVLRRANREPLDSILGETEFLGLVIPFNKNVLTPRQETEIMVDQIIRDNKNKPNLKVMDLCCGSGCIGLSIAKHIPSASVTLSDISKDAINIAKNNAQINDINVLFVESDLFNNIEEKYDIIVSNPPYIPSGVVGTLEKEVVDYDPILALDGGEDGLDLYRRIAKEIDKHLNDNGLVYIEFGIDQTSDIINIFSNSLDNIEIIKDYSGIDRYLKARKRIYVK